MASNNRYDYAQARYNIKQLQDTLGYENYAAWYAQEISEFDNWVTIDAKVQVALIDLEQRDYQQTVNDTRTWARGG